jgi:hypothetical protein
MPVLAALPFLIGANGPGCGGPVTIGSGMPGDGGVPSSDSGTSKDSCPGLGCFPQCPNGVLKDANGCDTCQCAPSPDAGGSGACTTDADCANGGICGFLEAAGCGAAGQCFPAPAGARCAIASIVGCGCNGSDVSIDPSCYSGLPSGYQSKPVLHEGACTDASASGSTWYWTCGDPVCQAPEGDAGLTDDAGAPCPPVASSCATQGETCGTRSVSSHCGAIEICADQNPAVNCPVSSRRFKDDIEYVDDGRLAKLHDEAMRIRLATYNYKPEVADPKPRHLGFVIEDLAPSPAVDPGLAHVDMYGYVSMVLAAMQVQEKEIAELRQELERARAGVCEETRARSR